MWEKKDTLTICGHLITNILWSLKVNMLNILSIFPYIYFFICENYAFLLLPKSVFQHSLSYLC